MKWLLAVFLSSDSLVPFKKRQLDKTIRVTKTMYIAAE